MTGGVRGPGSPGNGQVIVAIPDGFLTAPDIAPPDVSQVPGLHVVEWSAWRSPQASANLVATCVSADVPTWTPEAEPIVLERIAGLVSSTAVRLAGVGQRRVVGRSTMGSVVSEKIEGMGDADHRLSARTFLGFVEPRGSPHLLGCAALCVHEPVPAGLSCDEVVERATVEGSFIAAPAPGLLARALVGATERPQAVLACGLGATLLLATVAVATRRRPRTK